MNKRVLASTLEVGVLHGLYEIDPVMQYEIKEIEKFDLSRDKNV